MNRKNLYYAQFGEALKLAQSNIFEYKRISLVLFDNIIENLLINQNTIRLKHLLVMNEIQKNEYESIIKSFNKFENIISKSLFLSLINESEKNIIDYCHKTRNNLYHHLFADKRMTEFCILYYCNFLENKFESFLDIGIIGYSERESKSTQEILEVEKVNNFEEIVTKLKKYNHLQKTTPQKILSEIISDYIWQITDAMVNETFDTYKELNKIANEHYNNYNKNEKYNGLNSTGFIKQWYLINETNIVEMKNMCNDLQNCSLEKSYKKFYTLLIKLEPAYIGIMLYYSEQEYSAS
ncbi:MAG: hypothetical protein NTZ33_06175 [Bacteroidetes bacterium]|nr:hypothetical protein [Bacteroidota bacterium]